MKYGITTSVVTSPGLVELSEQEYLSISSAKRCLLEALFIEQKFEVLIENYFDYETELLSLSTRFMLFPIVTISQMDRESLLINRRLANLLSSGKTYWDQSQRHISNIYRRFPAKIQAVKDEKKHQNSVYIGLRAMDFLRDYAQHYDFPIHMIQRSFTRRNPSDDKMLVTLTPKLDIAELEKDRDFKKFDLEILKLQGNEIEIKPLMLQYIESMFRIHMKIRELIHADVLLWEEQITHTIELFKNRFGQEASILGLAIITESEDGIRQETVDIFTDFLDWRHELETKNSFLEQLSSLYVSSETSNDQE
jgi:hypothetical protein